MSSQIYGHGTVVELRKFALDLLNRLETIEDYAGRLIEVVRPHLTEDQVTEFGYKLCGLVAEFVHADGHIKGTLIMLDEYNEAGAIQPIPRKAPTPAPDGEMEMKLLEDLDKVVQRWACGDSVKCVHFRRAIAEARPIISARARREALEEAGKIADAQRSKYVAGADWEDGYRTSAGNISAAIRASKGTPNA